MAYEDGYILNWKKSIDDIKIICKACNREMILESTRNDIQGLFVCTWCGGHVNIIVDGGEERRDEIEDYVLEDGLEKWRNKKNE